MSEGIILPPVIKTCTGPLFSYWIEDFYIANGRELSNHLLCQIKTVLFKFFSCILPPALQCGLIKIMPSILSIMDYKLFGNGEVTNHENPLCPPFLLGATYLHQYVYRL